MLQTISLRDFVIVDQLELDFASGFTVLTGETGAGKSILLDALGLVLGERADSSQIREGSNRAEISATFRVEPELVKSFGFHATRISISLPLIPFRMKLFIITSTCHV